MDTDGRTTAETIAGHRDAANQANTRRRGTKDGWTRPGRRAAEFGPNG
jgi:hypothetical protein